MPINKHIWDNMLQPKDGYGQVFLGQHEA